MTLHLSAVLFRLSEIDAASPGTFPVDELAQSTTLDLHQAQALKLALTQEIALIQGPPGTGRLHILFACLVTI